MATSTTTIRTIPATGYKSKPGSGPLLGDTPSGYRDEFSSGDAWTYSAYEEKSAREAAELAARQAASKSADIQAQAIAEQQRRQKAQNESIAKAQQAQNELNVRVAASGKVSIGGTSYIGNTFVPQLGMTAQQYANQTKQEAVASGTIRQKDIGRAGVNITYTTGLQESRQEDLPSMNTAPIIFGNRSFTLPAATSKAQGFFSTVKEKYNAAESYVSSKFTSPIFEKTHLIEINQALGYGTPIGMASKAASYINKKPDYYAEIQKSILADVRDKPLKNAILFGAGTGIGFGGKVIGAGAIAARTAIWGSKVGTAGKIAAVGIKGTSVGLGIGLTGVYAFDVGAKTIALPKSERLGYASVAAKDFLLFSGGAYAGTKSYNYAFQKIKTITPLRQPKQDFFIEAKRTEVRGGKELRLSRYNIYGESQPPRQVVITNRARSFLGIKPIKEYILSAVKTKTFTPFEVVNNEPFTVASFTSKNRKTAKLSSITGSLIERNPRVDRLGKIDTLLLSRAKEKQLGRAVGSKIAAKLYKRGEVLDIADISSQRLGTATPSKSELRVINYGGKSTATSRALIETTELPSIEGSRFKVSKSRLTFKDVTKPFSRATGKTSSMRGIIIEDTIPTIIDDTFDSAVIKRTSMFPSVSAQEQVEVQTLKQLPKLKPKTSKAKTQTLNIGTTEKGYGNSLYAGSSYGVVSGQSVRSSNSISSSLSSFSSGFKEYFEKGSQQKRASATGQVIRDFNTEVKPLSTETLVTPKSYSLSYSTTRSITAQKPVSEFKQGNSLRNLQEIKNISELKTLSKLKQSQKLSQLQKYKQVSKSSSRGIFNPPRLPKPKQEVKPLVSLYPKLKSPSSEGAGFGVAVRRFGKWKPYAKGLSLGKALNIGKGYTGRTLGASFKLIGAKNVKVQTPRYYTKQEKGENIFIQKRKFRLSSPTEKSSIQMYSRSSKSKNRRKR